MRRMRVLVAFDGSPASVSALRIGSRLAGDMNARLAVTHVAGPSEDGPSPAAPLQLAAGILSNAGVQAESLSRRGEAAEEILGTARLYRADLLIIGSRGRSSLASLVLGSVSEEVLRRSDCPVLVVREGAEKLTSIHPILLAVEGIEGSESLVAVAGPLARALRAPVSVVHVSYPGGEDLERSLYHASRTHGEEACAAAVAALKRRRVEAQAHALESRLGLARAIAAYAAEIGADLIVMGSHGDSGEPRGADKSLSVGHLTTRPVLIVRER